MVPDPDIEEEDCQSVEIGLGRGVAFPADELRGHVLHRAPDLAAGLAVHPDVVVVADEHVAGLWIEHQVSRRDVPVTVAREVEGPVAVRKLVRDLAERCKARDRF